MLITGMCEGRMLAICYRCLIQEFGLSAYRFYNVFDWFAFVVN